MGCQECVNYFGHLPSKKLERIRLDLISGAKCSTCEKENKSREKESVLLKMKSKKIFCA